MYQQATRSNAATMGLLFIFLLDFLVAIPGAYVVCGRMLWTLARDDATPASGWLRHVSDRWRNPLNAQLISGCCVTLLGCVYIASDRAFNAFVGTFAILTTLSYLTAILPNLLTGRKYIRPGPVSPSIDPSSSARPTSFTQKRKKKKPTTNYSANTVLHPLPLRPHRPRRRERVYCRL
jgi:amino acid transporter